ncbi:MAG TPA: 50S ribosomal protein L25 [Acidimicrobiales bacterium]|nr:50S ribosomal protein L25 [Acidimicrobiales bacterium]
MPETILAAEPRAGLGSAESRRLRATGRVPAVLYGHGSDPLALSVDARELRHAFGADAGSNALVDLRLGTDSHLVIAREVQQHPVRHTVSHVDFQIVSRDEVIHADVPLHLVGESEEVTRGGGTIEHVVQTLSVHARAADIPAGIEIDVSGLVIGHTIHLGDLPAIKGVTYDADPDTVLVAVPVPRGMTEEEVAEEAAEAAGGGEGAEAAGGASAP